MSRSATGPIGMLAAAGIFAAALAGGGALLYGWQHKKDNNPSFETIGISETHIGSPSGIINESVSSMDSPPPVKQEKNEDPTGSVDTTIAPIVANVLKPAVSFPNSLNISKQEFDDAFNYRPDKNITYKDFLNLIDQGDQKGTLFLFPQDFPAYSFHTNKFSDIFKANAKINQYTPLQSVEPDVKVPTKVSMESYREALKSTGEYAEWIANDAIVCTLAALYNIEWRGGQDKAFMGKRNVGTSSCDNKNIKFFAALTSVRKGYGNDLVNGVKAAIILALKPNKIVLVNAPWQKITQEAVVSDLINQGLQRQRGLSGHPDVPDDPDDPDDPEWADPY